MADKRYEKILTAVSALAQAEGTPLSMRHVCRACVAALDVDGAALLLACATAPVEPALATDPVSENLAETQAMLGEGPALDCLTTGQEVAVNDLSAHASQTRWPAFAPATVAVGVHTVTALPMVMGAVSIGVVQVHRGRPSGLTPIQLDEGRVFARVALALLLEHILAHPEADIRDDLLADGLQVRWAWVSQAVGMVAAQRGSGVDEACLRLRATAFVQGRRLSDVAVDVITGRLRYQPDRR